MVAGHREIKWELTWKLFPWWLDFILLFFEFIVQESVIQFSGEKKASVVLLSCVLCMLQYQTDTERCAQRCNDDMSIPYDRHDF